ncbi:UNVERIFIED_CONTAM: hypothetical protein FKN15_056223, partial [Acipenser sinensis]
KLCMKNVFYSLSPLSLSLSLSHQLAGTAVLAVGLWLRFDSKTKAIFEMDTHPTTFYTAGVRSVSAVPLWLICVVLCPGVYILIGAGALMMVVGFLGCCGAIQESPCMLGLFFAFLLLIFAIEIAAGIWGFSNKDKVVSEVEDFYKETYKNYILTKQPALKETLKAFHHGLKCCGIVVALDPLVKETCPETDGIIATLTMPVCICLVCTAMPNSLAYPTILGLSHSLKKKSKLYEHNLKFIIYTSCNQKQQLYLQRSTGRRNSSTVFHV